MHAICSAPPMLQVLAQRQLLERLFRHEMGFPEERLRRAVSYAGTSERLHRALHKLIRGDAVTVATVGGSVTGGPPSVDWQPGRRNIATSLTLDLWVQTCSPSQPAGVWMPLSCASTEVLCGCCNSIDG